MYVTVFNPSDAPVALGSSGRSVGGGEWAPVNRTNDLVQDAGDRLVEVDPPPAESLGGVDPAARAAFEQAATWQDRFGTVSDFDKPTCRGLALRAGLISADDEPHVEELRRLLTESEADLTRPGMAKKQAAAVATEKKD